MVKSLRAKTYLLICIYIVGLLTIIGILSNRIMMDRILQLEYSNRIQDIYGVTSAIQSEIDRIDSIANDWASRYDLYIAIRDQRPYNLQNLLSAEALDNLQVNAMSIVDLDGRVILSQNGSPRTGQESPTLTELQTFVDLHPGLISRPNAPVEISGLINTPKDTLLLSTAPIVSETITSPIIGTLLVTHSLNIPEVSQFHLNSSTQAHYLRVGGLSSQPEYASAYQALLTTGQPVLIPQDAHTLYGYQLFKDIYGDPAIVVQITAPREIYQYGIQSLWFYVAAICIAGLIIGALFMFGLDYGILRRVEMIAHSVKTVKKHSDASIRIHIDGEDELSTLAGQINEMLEELHQSALALQENQTRLEYETQHDALTGFKNRTHFLHCLEQAIRHAAARPNAACAVLFLDLDRFKLVNDSFDHTFGDQLLVLLSQRLKTCVPEHAVVARFGGDEFAILLENIAAVPAAIEVAERIERALTAAFVIRDQSLYITASIGIAVPTPGDRGEDVLRNADLAMYRAKAEGKARYALFDNSLHSTSRTQLDLQNDIHRGLMRNEFVVYYQPIVNLPDHKITTVEALVRWNHPIHGLLQPGDFLPIAEETNLIIPLSEVIIETVFRQLKTLRADSDTPIKAAINLSYRQFQQAGFLDWVKDKIRETGVSPDWFYFELTENAVIHDFFHTLNTLHELKQIGIRLSLDDFGTGYSSLEQIKYLPVDVLKIDRNFMNSVIEPGEDQAVVTAIIQMAGLLGMDTVAEGVETFEQAEFLTSRGCHQAQGFYYSRPVPFEQLQDILGVK